MLLVAVLAPLAVNAGVNRWSSGGPDGGRINAVAIDPANAAHVYAGTEAGIFRSVDGGDTWQLFSEGLALPPSTFLPRIGAFAFAPTVRYAGGGTRVFRSSADGSGWTVTAPLGSLIGSVVSALAVDPTDPNTVYAGTYDGVYKSADGGASWIPARNGFDCFYVGVLAVDPKTPATLYASGCGNLFKSENGGGSWTPSGNGLPVTSVLALAVDPRTPSIVYAGTLQGVFRSSDGAATWSRTSNGLPPLSEVETVAIHPDDSSTLYAATTDGLLMKSRNGGGSWSFSDASLGQVYALALRGPRLFAATGTGVFRNDSDGAPPWNFTSRGIHAREVRALAIDGATPHALYAADVDGSVLRSTDNGGSWIPRNEGITGEVRSLAVDPASPDTIYASATGGMFKSVDGGASWTNRSTGLAPEFVTEKLVVAPSSPGTVYASEFDFRFQYKTVDGAASWIYLGSENARILAVDPTSSDIVYAGGGLAGTGALKSINGGLLWTPINTGLDEFAYVLTMTVDRNAPSTVYCGTSQHGIYKSVDSGATWRAINEGLPTDFDLRQLLVRAIVVDPTNSSILYAATASKGVFRSFNGGASWSSFSEGLTSGLVYDLVLDETGKFLHAATYTGLFDLELAPSRRRSVRH